MDSNRKCKATLGAMVLMMVVGTGIMAMSGCSNKNEPPPVTQLPQDQMYQKIQQDAKNMAAYRQAHPLNGAPAPAAGQPAQ